MTETTSADLELIVRSKRVLARIEEFDVPLGTWNGQVGHERRQVRVYEYVLDDRQQRALRWAGEAAERSGLTLKVTDLTRQSPLKRLVMRLGGAGLPGALLQHLSDEGASPDVETRPSWRWRRPKTGGPIKRQSAPSDWHQSKSACSSS